MTSDYPLVFRGLAKAAYLLGFGGSVKPIGLPQNQVRRSLEIGPFFRPLQRWLSQAAVIAAYVWCVQIPTAALWLKEDQRQCHRCKHCDRHECISQLPSISNERLHPGTHAYIFVFIGAFGQKRIEVFVIPELAPD